MIKPLYDEFGQPMLQSMVSEEIWALYKANPAEFKRRVRDHFALGMPGWRVYRANYKHRVIWLQDQREGIGW